MTSDLLSAGSPLERNVRLRVHFAAMGLEVRRLVRPAELLRADVMMVLTDRRSDLNLSALRKALRLLAASRIRTQVINCDVWDTPTVIDTVGGIVTTSRQHDYLFNVSTGAKTACIGGAISSMFWPIRPYYQPVSYGSNPTAQDPQVDGPPSFIPTLATPTPDFGSIETLRYLVGQSRPVSKRELIAHMKSTNTIYPRSSAIVTPQAFHAQAGVILRHLLSANFVEIEGRGKGMRISVTESGRGGARMFAHVLDPRKSPRGSPRPAEEK